MELQSWTKLHVVANCVRKSPSHLSLKTFTLSRLPFVQTAICNRYRLKYLQTQSKIEPQYSVRGIKVDKKEIKVSLYADDTTVFMRDLDSITHLLTLLNDFKNLSGLEINTSKTEGKWLGCWKNNTVTPFGFCWPREPIKALGIFFSYDSDKANELKKNNESPQKIIS